MHPLIEEHSAEILNLARKRGISNVRLFGSLVRDEPRDDSDVDLLVELLPGRSALALGGFLMDVRDLLGREVDVVTESSLHPRIRQKVLKEARAL